MNNKTVKKPFSSLPFYTLEAPKKEQVHIEKASEFFSQNPQTYRTIFEKANEPTYIHWEKFKYKFPDDELTSEEKWFFIRKLRTLFSQQTPIKASNGEYFKWFRLPSTDEFLHKIDMLTGGQLLPHNYHILQDNRQVFINRGIIEEAIASSQLEGAHTTRVAAKKMIIEKREPRNTSEKMIMNNYKTIQAIEEHYKNNTLTLELLFEIHALLTQDTVEKQEQFRLRKDKDNVVVQGQIGHMDYIAHIPPKQSFLQEHIHNLIAYANDEQEKQFIHPIIKAIFIHFWVGYLHPFTDGNGRLARSLFYWYLLKKGYGMFMYLPISTVIKKAPSQYAMAYIYSEQDNYDITYFYDFHMQKILQSMDDFQKYVSKKVLENKEIDEIISKKIDLNSRQKQLIHYLISDHTASTTVSSYATINMISRQTAAKDLKKLEDNNIVKSKREGKYIRYYSSSLYQHP